MKYQHLPPTPALKDYIRCYWWLDNNTDQPLEFTILPDGCFDLIISFEHYKQNCITLSGLFTKAIDVAIKPHSQLFGIQFRLLALDYILGENIAQDLNKQRRMASDFWNLNDLVFFQNNNDQIAQKLSKQLESIIQNQRETDVRKQQLFNLLYKSNGNETIEYYADQVFWSRRQITRYFKNRFGLSFKAYCNILKCSSSYKHLQKGQIYPEQNYYDRSHFNKELKKHTGQTASKLIKNENDRFLQLSIMDMD